MLETETLLLGLIVIFAAGFTQSLTGFGFGLIAIPLLTLFISPKLAQPMVLVNGIILSLLILRGSYRLVELRRIWVLMVAGLAGVPFGTWILANWDVQSLRIYIGVMTIVVAMLFFAGLRREIRRENMVSVPVGFIGGVMSGSINMGGPPVILFFANQSIPRAIFRAKIVAYFLVVQFTAVPLLISNGILTRGTLGSGLVILPGLIFGGLIGSFFAAKVPETLVRQITLFVVCLAGSLSVLKGLGII